MVLAQENNRRPILTVRDLAVQTAEGEPLVHGVDLSLSKGEYLLLTGENGSGKSTVAQTLVGSHRFFSGRIETQCPRSRVGYLPQLGNVRFFLPLTLADVVGLRGRHPELKERVLHLGLLSPESLELSWNTASGGERQKALMTRTFLENPELLILDEPFNHLDQHSRSRLESLLISRLEAKDLALILISHEGELGGKRPAHVLELGKAPA